MRNRACLVLWVLTASSAAFGQEAAAGATGTTTGLGPMMVPHGGIGDTFAAPNGQLGAGLSISRAEGFRMYGELGFYSYGDSSSFGDIEFSQRIWSFSAIVGGGVKIQPNLEIEAMLPLAFYDFTVTVEGPDDEESDGESGFGVGNLHLGINYLRAQGPLRMKIGGAVQYGLWTIDPSDDMLGALVFGALARGGQDIFLWAPETLSVVTPSRIEYGGQVVFSGDGALGLHVPTDGGDVEASIQLAPGFGYYASPTVLVGARLPFAWYPTESGSDATFLAFEPYGRFDVSESAFLNARFTLNIDEPLGFSFDEGRIWALHFGGGGTF
ncbi:MAG TPA: hypothetical protein VFZ53_34880 [Polyangiaceae bacterium]